MACGFHILFLGDFRKHKVIWAKEGVNYRKIQYNDLKSTMNLINGIVHLLTLFQRESEWQESNINKMLRVSLVAQRLRICLPMQGHGFKPWSGKIPHAAEQLGPWATTTEPARLEPVLRNKRGCDSERPTRRDEEWSPLAATRESPRTETKTQHSQK